MRMTSFGFSLIELMIVITIISILSATALPTYKHYTQRARFTEVITATQVYKTAVAIALEQGATLSDLRDGNEGIPTEFVATRNVNSVHVQNGIITATGSSLVDETTYILSPNEDGTHWQVSGTCLTHGFCHA